MATNWAGSFLKKKGIKIAKEHKYRAKPVSKELGGGRSFGSGLERARHGELLFLEKAGEIRELNCQVQVELSDAKIIYKPDFRYFDIDLGETVWEETKGVETKEWRIKRRLWLFYGPGLLRVLKGTAARIVLHEEIRPRVVKGSK